MNMSNRISAVTTRTGDDGTTGLSDGSRVSKASVRMNAVGDVDELNSCLGMLLLEELPQNVRDLLLDVQHQLFALGGELVTPGAAVLSEEAVIALENAVADCNAQLPRLREFILPGGCRAAAQAHVCRTVARRAERSTVAIRQAGEPLRDEPLRYLNRLSDLLFVLARLLNQTAGVTDVYWKSRRLESQGTPV